MHQARESCSSIIYSSQILKDIATIIELQFKFVLRFFIYSVLEKLYLQVLKTSIVCQYSTFAFPPPSPSLRFNWMRDLGSIYLSTVMVFYQTYLSAQACLRNLAFPEQHCRQIWHQTEIWQRESTTKLPVQKKDIETGSALTVWEIAKSHAPFLWVFET